MASTATSRLTQWLGAVRRVIYVHIPPKFFANSIRTNNQKNWQYFAKLQQTSGCKCKDLVQGKFKEIGPCANPTNAVRSYVIWCVDFKLSVAHPTGSSFVKPFHYLPCLLRARAESFWRAYSLFVDLKSTTNPQILLAIQPCLMKNNTTRIQSPRSRMPTRRLTSR